MSKILCMTSDKYIHAVRPFMYLINKYWPNHPGVTVAGFTPPDFEMPIGSEFISLGKFEDYPVNRWSDGMYKALQAIDEEVVLVMLEDMWVVREVNDRAMSDAYDYMLHHPKVAKFDTGGDRLYAEGAKLDYGYWGQLDLVLSKRESPYQLSMMAGYWRTEHLIAAMRPGWTPWQVEIDGTTIIAQMDVDVVGSRNWPLRHTLAFRSGDSSTLLLDELKLDDVEKLKSMGYI